MKISALIDLIFDKDDRRISRVWLVHVEKNTGDSLKLAAIHAWKWNNRDVIERIKWATL